MTLPAIHLHFPNVTHLDLGSLWGSRHVLSKILTIIERIEALANDLDDKITALQASVSHIDDVAESAITLINGLKAQLDAAIAAASSAGATAGQLSSLVELSSALNTEGDKLAAAVAANTPATSGGDTGATGPTGDTGATGPTG